MGYGVPAGIAANIVTGRTALTMAGDGDFLMNGQELATAAQYGAKTIIVLLNNGMFGTIRMHQERDYPRHVQRHAAGQPGFRGAGAGLWLCGCPRHAHAQFEPELLAALERKQGTLIEVMLDPEVITTRGTLSAITEGARRAQGLRGCVPQGMKKEPHEPALCKSARRPDYLTCLPIRPAISNMETWALPKISFSLASALTMRLLTESCSLFFLM